MNIYRKMSLFIFPCFLLILALLIGVDNYHLLTDRNSVIFTYSRNFKEGNIGYGNQSITNNAIAFSELKPGDILLGGWTGCAYGYFSHAGLYVGNHKVLESYVKTGVTLNSISHYRDYPRACILRVKADDEIKQKAIDYALQQQGKVFYPVAFKNDGHYWNCTKIIWKAYQRQGVDLDDNHDLWIPPEAFYHSSRVEIIALKGGAPD